MGLVSKTVDDCACKHGVFEEVFPLFKGEVGGDDNAALAMAVGKQVEEQLTTGLVEGDVAQFVQDNEVVAFKFSAVDAELVLAHGFL